MTKQPEKTPIASLGDPELPQGGGVRLGTLVLIRWMAVGGQLLALLFVHYVLNFEVYPHLTMPVVLSSALLNLWLSLKFNSNTRLNNFQAALLLAFDLMHLASLLFITGGLANPFSVLMLAPTTVSASILGRLSTKLLLLLSLALVTALAFTPFPLPWDGEPPFVHPLLEAGLWVSLCFALIFIALYVARVGRDSRHRARALAATQAALEQEQRLAALGTLAAAAAHELGTPLGTILLAAKDRLEIMKAESEDTEAQADLELIVSETTRCRDILAEIGRDKSAGKKEHFNFMSVEALLREASDPHADRKTEIDFDVSGEGPLVIRHMPEIIHAVRNIVENAVGFAKSNVLISAYWNNRKLSITIEDNGPGFDPQVIKKLGEPYITTRNPAPGHDGGLGLGLFIAKTLLERTGASIRFDQSSLGGAKVIMEWKRGTLIEDAETAGG